MKKTGNAKSSGKVVLNVTGIVGRICQDGWTNEDAQVACKELGYTLGEAYYHYEASYKYISCHSLFLLTTFYSVNVHCCHYPSHNIITNVIYY